MKYLYHGSTVQNLKTLIPRRRYIPSGKISIALVYATPLQAYAAGHAFPWSSEEGFDIEVKEGRVVLKVPKGQEGRLEVPISIYKVDGEKFEQTKEEETGYTWHSFDPVDVIEEVQYENVRKAIEKFGGTVLVEEKIFIKI